MRHAVQIAPSILAADFAHLGAQVDAVADVVELLHVDVMDGHFVPNISLGPPVISSLRDSTSLFLDCHLMITDPLRYLGQLADAGANGVTAHIEAIPDPEPFLESARDLGLRAGLVLNPSTPAVAIEPFLDQCDKVVVMSVHPGFGGQAFIESVLPKISTLRETIDSRALATDIEVDGGVDIHTAGLAWSAGADILVAGTSVFRANDPVKAVGDIRRVCESSGDS